MKKINILLIITIFLISSCTSTKNFTQNNENLFYKKYKENTIHKELSNGIQVVINNNKNANVNSVCFYFKTGSSSLPIDKSGVSTLVLSLMNTHSKHFSQENKERLLNKTLSKTFFTSSSTMSSISITSLTKYFPQVFPILKDAIKNPDFSNYEIFLKQKKFELENTSSVDLDLLHILAEEDLKNKTNYLGKNKILLDNIDSIAEEDLFNFYNDLFTEDSIYILCAGNFETKSFIKDLEKSFGKIKLQKNKNKNLIFDYKFESSIIEFDKNNNPKLDYAMSYINFPEDIDKYYASGKLVSLIYSDILYNIVREKNGSVYSVASVDILCNKPFFRTLGYRISDKNSFFDGVNEAKNILKDKKIIYGKSANNEYIKIPIEEKLDNYKNQLKNIIYTNSSTSEGKIFLMQSGLILGKDTDFMFQFENKINQVTKENLYQCIDIILSNDEQWYYLTGVK